METDEKIFRSMVLKTVLDRFLDDGFSNQRELQELVTEFPAKKVWELAGKWHTSFDGTTYGGLPVLNAQAAPAAPQQQYAPQSGPQPIQAEIAARANTGAPPTLWASGPNDHIPPVEINSMGKWGDQVPIKYKKGEVCQSTGKLWADTTYFDILDQVQMDMTAPGKPTYQSDWDNLSFCIKTTKCDDPKWGKANRWRVGCLKAVMTEIAKRRPQQKAMRVPSQGTHVPGVEETQELLQSYREESTPF